MYNVCLEKGLQILHQLAVCDTMYAIYLSFSVHTQLIRTLRTLFEAYIVYKVSF